MQFTDHERRLRAGDRGEAARLAFEQQVAVGEFFGAERFVPVTNVHMSSESFSIRYHMDRETGVISRKGHPLEGQSLAGKIVYFPAVQGGVAAGWAFLALAGRGVAPAGVLFGRTNPVMIQGLVLAGIPVMHQVTPDPFTVLGNGDRVRMSPARGVVELVERGPRRP